MSKVSAAAVAVLLAVGGALAVAGGAAAAPVPSIEDGDSVYVGPQYQISGAAMIFPVWNEAPADPANPGTPDYWGYCLEQSVSAVTSIEGVVGDFDSFIGSNYVATDPAIPGKILWVLAHSYPALSIAELATASGIPGLTLDDAISGTTTATWRYTDVTFDAEYHWISPNAEALYRYLVGGANASSGMSPADFETTVSVTAPAAAQTAGTLIGPFVVNTNKPTASVTVTAPYALTDAAGTAIDPAAVVDGQELYVDARAVTDVGSVTVTASAVGSSATGKVITIPTTSGGTPTAADHGQSIVLVAAGGSTTEAQATTAWAAVLAPAIGTLATTDNPADDKVLPLTGGTITDVVGYEGLAPNVCTVDGCETEYVIEGELMLVVGGTVTPTGITGASAPFTVAAPSAPGTVAIAFPLSAAQAVLYAGETLVVYEYLYEWDYTGAVPMRTLVAQHTDPADADQTVTVASLPVVGGPGNGAGGEPAPRALAVTGSGSPTGVLVAGAVLLAAGMLLLVRRALRPAR